MAKGLTVKSIDKLSSQLSRIEVPDGLLPGLYLVVQPSGAKSWAVRYRRHGRPAKATIGRYPAITLEKARELARGVMLAVAEGKDPAADKRQARAETEGRSFGEVAARFIERYAKANTRESSWKEAERLLNVEAFPRWRHRQLDDIKRADIVELLDGIVDRGASTTANRVLACVRRLFNWTVERGLLERSPCEGVRPPAAETSRDRVLSDAELLTLWRVADGIAWPFGYVLQLLILTGQRRDEVAAMRWSEIDLDKRTWIIPRERSKNGIAHEVPLSDPVMAILESLPRIMAGGRASEFVFTSTGASPVSGFSRAKLRVDAAIIKHERAASQDPQAVKAWPRWTVHDLRRTFASGAARLGIGLPTIEKILNHTSGSFRGVAGVYQRHEFSQEKRIALEAWAAHVTSLAAPRAGNVVALRG
jgi:integrase